MNGIRVENGVALGKDGRPEAWHLWSESQRQIWREKCLMDFKRESGLDLRAIVHDAVKAVRRANPTRREMIEKYNLEAKMSAALKEAVRNLRAEAASKKLVTRGELAREFMRRGVR